MGVYVDDMQAPFGRMKMCHMLADTTEELLAMADTIGVSRHWIQHANTHREHFDICQSKKSLAIQYGALAITQKDAARLIAAKRTQLLREATL